MRGFMKYACVLALPLLVAAGAAQAQTWPDGGNPSEGATLYDSCVPCHTLNGNGLAGKSVSDLMDKMKAYQSGTFTDAKLLGMQQVLKPLSDKQLLDQFPGSESPCSPIPPAPPAASGSCGLYQQDVIPRKKGLTSPCSLKAAAITAAAFWRPARRRSLSLSGACVTAKVP